MAQYNTVLFDLDGTLIDSEPGVLKTMQATLARCGIERSAEDLRKYLGPPLRATFADFLAPELVEGAVTIYREIYAQSGIFACTLYPGVDTMLRRLKAVGFTVALATCKAEIHARQILEHFKLDDVFDFIGGATLTAKIDTKQAVIQYVLSQPCMMHKKPIMVGDRGNDLAGAAVHKIDAAAVLYGYGTKAELEAYAPQVMVRSTPELGQWLVEHLAL